MKRDTINYAVVGGFVALVGAGFLILMYAVTGNSGPSDSYVTHFSNVTGLKFGTGVFYEGYRVGQVENIEPEGSGAGLRYKVDLSVAKGWQIPTDSRAAIVAGGLISAMTVEISAGNNSQAIPVGGEIPSSEQGDIFAALMNLSEDGIKPLLATLTTRMNQLADEYVALRRDDLSPLLQMLNTRTDAVLARTEQLLSDGNQEHIASTLENVDDASENLAMMLKEFHATRAALHEVAQNLNEMLTSNRPAIDSSVTQLEQSLTSLNTILSTVESRIDSIVYHLEGGAQNAHEFARIIRANPGTILRGTKDADEGVAQ
ncbi:MAG: MCE family protein [Gammaproteobacteria bacterium]|nr:MCE family protein [Gammaproteobacteria bacterium]